MTTIRTALSAAALAAAAVVPAAPVALAPLATAPVAVAAPVADPVVHAHDHATHSHAHHTHAAPAPRKAAVRPARPVVLPPAPHWDGRAFATPEAAMRFLAAAYNSHADVELKHVTTPDARMNLVAMRDYAPALRLRSCAKVDSGAYDCEFWHSLAQPVKGQEGYARFRVAPALKPGWYMTVLEECGDAEA